jgi:hypothetical protein
MTRTASPSCRLRVEALEDREVPAILFGVTANNVLVTFDSANPSVILRATPINGFISPGEVITDIDVRPALGFIYGRSNLDRLFLISPFNGFAQLPVGNPLPITAATMGFDFDPRTDQIRIFSNLGENVLQNPNTGARARVATPLSYRPGDPFQGGAPRVTGLAFTNPVASARISTLFAIDHARNTLVRPVGSINTGILTTVGGLGADVTGRVGFDIAPQTSVAFASFQLTGEGISRLFVVNLGNGRATQIAPIAGLLLHDIAVDLLGASGFVSAAGFGALPPPPPVVTPGFNIPGFTSPTLISPTGAPVTTTPLFPTLTQPFPGTLTSPFFPGTVTGGGPIIF